MGRKKQQRSAELAERQVEKFYTREILSGRIAAGTRLPSNQALAEEWGTSSTSIQKAFAKLAAEGLIERAASRGTFVRDRQERALIGILVGPRMVRDTFWYYRELASAVMDEIESDFLTSRIYDGLSQSAREQGPGTQSRHLQVDRRYFNFRGYVEISSIQFASEIRIPDVPRVVQDVQLAENDFSPDYDDCIAQLGGLIAARQFQKIWVVAIYAPSLRKGTIGLVAHGLTSQMAGVPGVCARLISVEIHPSGNNVEAATHDAVLRALKETPRDEWPDLIIGCDDVGMRAIALAVLKIGLRVPEDVELLVVTSEGIDFYYSVPVISFRFPVRQLARDMVTLLKRRMAGENLPPANQQLKGWIELP